MHKGKSSPDSYWLGNFDIDLSLQKSLCKFKNVESLAKSYVELEKRFDRQISIGKNQNLSNGSSDNIELVDRDVMELAELINLLGRINILLQSNSLIASMLESSSMKERSK